MQVPLYVMSAGEVGFDSRHVESKLQGVFDMVTRWNAILLIDEADVFLEERSLHELERNKLVSIFLRVLVRTTKGRSLAPGDTSLHLPPTA